jgi:hypothetical protein
MHLDSKNVTDMKDKIIAIHSFNEDQVSVSHANTLSDGETYYDNDHASNDMSDQMDISKKGLTPMPTKHYKLDMDLFAQMLKYDMLHSLDPSKLDSEIITEVTDD